VARLLNDWLSAYMDYTSHSEAPDRFHFWTGVSTIAGALRKKVFINMGYFKWTPNFYIFFIAPAGIVSKSTTVSIGIDLLRELSYINFGPEALTWQALVQGLAEAREEYLGPDGNYYPMSALTIVASELGTFLDPDDRQLVDALVSLWDGKEKGPWEKWTKRDGREAIVAPWVNIIGCTTPAWVSQNVNEYFIQGGFASRSIFLWADTKRKLVAYPGLELPKNFEVQREALIHDLEQIASLVGEYELTEGAIKWGTAWYEKHYFSEPEYLRGDRFRGYLARKQTHIHKLAMVLAASHSDSLKITENELSRANDEITKLEEYMPKVFGEIGHDPKMMMAPEIFNFIAVNGRMEKMDVYRHFFRAMSYDNFEELVRSLINAAMIRQFSIGGKMHLELTKEAESFLEEKKQLA